MLLNKIEQETKQLLPNVNIENEIKALPKDSGKSLPTPETVRKWVLSKQLKDENLEGFLEEYSNVWTTGTMKNPSLIPFNQDIKVY
jgi:hypothetical protein